MVTEKTSLSELKAPASLVTAPFLYTALQLHFRQVWGGGVDSAGGGCSPCMTLDVGCRGRPRDGHRTLRHPNASESRDGAGFGVLKIKGYLCARVP